MEKNVTSENITSKEEKILLSLRKADFETVTIEKKQGKINLLCTKKASKLDGKVSELLNKSENQNILLKRRGGRVIFYEQTFVETL